MHTPLVTMREIAAVALMNCGAFMVDTKKGFPLKVHGRFPNAPLSPCYLNMRPQGTKGGTLRDPDFVVIADAMMGLARTVGLFDTRRYWDGIPAAGTPLAEMMQLVATKDEAENLCRFHLFKEDGTDGTRKIAGITNASFGPPDKTQNVLLVDDVITAGGTKLEAIEVIESEGGKVTDLLVFLDRSEDGEKMLAERGVTLHSVWTWDYLLEYYLAYGHINRKTFEAIISYPELLAKYIKAQ